MYILARHRGAVIHAAGIEINGKGFIFAGPSGAGKSTLSRLFNAETGQDNTNTVVLSDERIVTRKINGRFKAYGTPWHGEEGTTRNKCSPLSGIFFLNHGKENRAKPLQPRQALEKLLKVTSIPWYDREIMSAVLLFCEELLTRVPLFELHFTPGLEAVRFLETWIRHI
jgi:energy-coupling factor transporter ATP-binding protein EcfA2